MYNNNRYDLFKYKKHAIRIDEQKLLKLYTVIFPKLRKMSLTQNNTRGLLCDVTVTALMLSIITAVVGSEICFCSSHSSEICFCSSHSSYSIVHDYREMSTNFRQ